MQGDEHVGSLLCCEPPPHPVQPLGRPRRLRVCGAASASRPSCGARPAEPSGASGSQHRLTPVVFRLLWVPHGRFLHVALQNESRVCLGTPQQSPRSLGKAVRSSQGPLVGSGQLVLCRPSKAVSALGGLTQSACRWNSPYGLPVSCTIQRLGNRHKLILGHFRHSRPPNHTFISRSPLTTLPS